MSNVIKLDEKKKCNLARDELLLEGACTQRRYEIQ
jgi:hypothetical protein